MKTVNYMKITFPAMSKNEALARSCVAAFAAGADPTVEELTDIRSAVCEAVTNAIVHGCGRYNRHSENDRGQLSLHKGNR